MLEIPRNVTPNIWKLVLGLLTVVVAVGIGLDPIPGHEAVDALSRWIAPVTLAIIGLLLAWSNVRLLVRRPPWLRATAAGVWFGGGPVIPWQEIKAIYEAGIPIERYGFSVRTSAINVRFHRARTLLRLPWSLWLTTLAMDTVKVSLFAAADPPTTVLAQLEALRLSAVGHEDGAMPGSGGVPAARIVRE